MFIKIVFIIFYQLSKISFKQDSKRKKGLDVRVRFTNKGTSKKAYFYVHFILIQYLYI